MTPATPPIRPKTIDVSDMSETPQSAGTKLPIAPPTAAHSQIALRSMERASGRGGPVDIPR